MCSFYWEGKILDPLLLIAMIVILPTIIMCLCYLKMTLLAKRHKTFIAIQTKVVSRPSAQNENHAENGELDISRCKDDVELQEIIPRRNRPSFVAEFGREVLTSLGTQKIVLLNTGKTRNKAHSK